VKNRKKASDLFVFVDAEDPSSVGGTATGAVLAARAPDGKRLRVARSAVGDTGWTLYAVAEERQALAAFHGRLYRLAGWMILALAAFFLILRHFARRMTAPLAAAAAFASRLREGRLEERLAVPRQLECGQLVRSLNAMAETLHQRKHESEEAARIRDGMYVRVAAAAGEMTEIALHIHAQSDAGVNAANRQSADFDHFSETLGHFRAKAAEAARLAANSNDLLQKARDRAEDGNREMEGLSRVMSDLVQSSSDVSRVLKAINDIAFQTNLLSLNAAIEAARAGRQGKGFGVVAEEVRQLANRSAKAADETNEKLVESERHAEHGVKAGRQTAEALTGIRGATEDVAELVSDVARLSLEQSELLEQVYEGLQRVGRIAADNRARAVEGANASEQLRSTAESLRAMLHAAPAGDAPGADVPALPPASVPALPAPGVSPVRSR